MPANCGILPKELAGKDGFENGIDQVEGKLVLSLAIGQIAIITVQIAEGGGLDHDQIDRSKGGIIRVLCPGL